MALTIVKLYKENKKTGWKAYRGGRLIARSGTCYWKPVEAKEAFEKFLNKTYTEKYYFSKEE